eukprot:m.155871 g.155871  ORF g.155871 m.155871 type:complete len:58 (+) comp14422_c0_seq3:2383-2556(+)
MWSVPLITRAKSKLQVGAHRQQAWCALPAKKILTDGTICCTMFEFQTCSEFSSFQNY